MLWRGRSQYLRCCRLQPLMLQCAVSLESFRSGSLHVHSTIPYACVRGQWRPSVALTLPICANVLTEPDDAALF